MIQHDAIYLRRMSSGKHLVAIDVAKEGPVYLEIPPLEESVDIMFGAQQKTVQRHPDFQFGERLRLTLERQ